MTINDLPQGMTANTISLLLGHPDPTSLLTPELREAIQSALSHPQSYRALQYGPEQGTQALINFLVEKVNREQALSLQASQLMLVAGSTHAVDMIARLYAAPDGVVLVEAPTYVDAIHIFRDHHIELCSIPMDNHGLIVAELEKLLARLRSAGKSPNFLYTVPNFHNPTGITTSADRRSQVIELAQRDGFLIVEDDVYRDLSFEGAAPASYYALSGGKQVFSIGSFSKTLAPGLRLGWLIGSGESIQRCINCGEMQMGGGANPLTAAIVAEYCRKGYWEPHVANLRSLYRRRCDAALSALSRYMPAGITWTHPVGGFFIWLTLPENIFAGQVKQAARHAGVMVASGEGFFVNPSDGEHNLRLAFSFAAPDAIEAGIKILGQVIEQLKAVEQSSVR